MSPVSAIVDCFNAKCLESPLFVH